MFWKYVVPAKHKNSFQYVFLASTFDERFSEGACVTEVNVQPDYKLVVI